MKTSLRAALAVFISALASAALHAEPGYRYEIGSVTVSNLGALGGESSRAYDINDTGNIVGGAHTASGEWHAFLFRASGVKIDIGSGLGNARSQALGINASNVVVGWYSPGDAVHAFRWTTAGIVTLVDGSSSDPAARAEAHGISNVGLIAGYRFFNDGRPREATVWSDAFTSHSINGVSPLSSLASDINDAGLVVGDIAGRMTAWQVYPPFSSVLEIPLPAYCAGLPLYVSRMNGVNRWGVMAGHADCRAKDAQIDHALTWHVTSALPTDLGIYPGATATEGHDINDSYFVAGHSRGGGDSGFIYHRDFGMYRLPGIASPLGVGPCQALALNNINTNGLVQVVGYCTILSAPSYFRAVRWDVNIRRRSTTPPGPTP